MRPLTILRGRRGKRWSPVDRVLAVAHVLAGDMVCTGCGQPKHEAYNPDSMAWYEVRDAECSGCAAIAGDADAHKDHAAPGRKVWTVDTRPPDIPLMPWTP